MLNGLVFVGTDLTPAAEEVLRQGHQLATDLGSPLVVCHVLPELSQIRMLFPQWAGVDPAFQDTMTGKAQEAVERQLEAVLGSAGRGIRIVLDGGTAHVGLLEQADAVQAGVIVVGPGRVADRVVRHARVPVLVARASPRGVVIGATDFSDPSLPALDAAASEAHRRGSPLHLLHVVDIGMYAMAGPPGAGLPYLGATPAIALEAVDDMRVAAQARLDEHLDRFGGEGQTTALAGPAASTIVDLATTSGAELVVVGTHGRSGLSRMTLGSTAEAVIHSAPCSVLVVRLKAA